MALPKNLRKFYHTIHTNLPHLTKPQALTLALWRFAIIHTGTCGLTTVATYLALRLHQAQNTLRQRLREFYKDAAHKAGDQRRELDITPCFAALMRWILRLWTPHSNSPMSGRAGVGSTPSPPAGRAGVGEGTLPA